MSDGKAVIHTGRGGAVAVDFKNFSAIDRNDINILDEVVIGALFVYNSQESLLKENGKHSSDRQRFLEGIAGEVSHSCTRGWKNVYVSSIPHIVNDEEAYSSEFSTSEEDVFLDWNKLDDIRGVIESYSKNLRKVRVVGVVPEGVYNDFKSHLESVSSDVTIEDDSPYLVIV